LVFYEGRRILGGDVNRVGWERPTGGSKLLEPTEKGKSNYTRAQWPSDRSESIFWPISPPLFGTNYTGA
jgi:hypothetical protein